MHLVQLLLLMVHPRPSATRSQYFQSASEAERFPDEADMPGILRLIGGNVEDLDGEESPLVYYHLVLVIEGGGRKTAGGISDQRQRDSRVSGGETAGDEGYSGTLSGLGVVETAEIIGQDTVPEPFRHTGSCQVQIATGIGLTIGRKLEEAGF